MIEKRIVFCGLLGVLASTAVPFVLAAQTSCELYKVTAPILDVRKDANVADSYIDVLEAGDIACVTKSQGDGSDKQGFIAHKTPPGGQQTPVNGWVGLRYMVPQAKDAAAAPAPEKQKTAPTPKEIAKRSVVPVPATPAPAPASGGGLTFDKPVEEGPYPVRGKSLQELAQWQPLFSPIEGLEEALWQKPCSTCHKWNQKRLCEQGGSYIKSAKAVFRHQHPYGGPYKLALMRWAKAGCN